MRDEQDPGQFEPTFANEEAEQSLLGCMLISNRSVASVIDKVGADDFYVGVHARIFQEIVEITSQGGKADPITLRAKFQHDSDLVALDGPKYLADLAACVVSVVSAPDYAAAIRRLAIYRNAIAAIDDAKRAVSNAGIALKPAEVAVSEAITSLEKINFQSKKSRFQLEVGEEIVRGLTLPKKRYPTGIQALDDGMKGGLYEGYTYGIAAREKQGKTTLAHSISYNLNLSGAKHAYIALEMGGTQIEQRNLARSMGWNSLDFLKDMSDRKKQDIAHAVTRMPNNVIYVDMPGATFEDIQVEVSRLHIKHHITGFITDYWQLVTGRNQKGQTEENFLREVAQWHANFGREKKLWSILIAQLNESGETFAGRGIKKACDQLYYLHRCEAPRRDMAWLQMVASRYSPEGDIGSDEQPSLLFDTKVGPHFRDMWSSLPIDDGLDSYIE